jgi:murein DD-endopeptidase MepM/ murein hydrolase activator NlpD
VLADSVERNDTLITVWRFGANVRDGATYYVRWRLTPGDHRVSGFSAMDAGRAAETPRLNYQARTVLRLPFDGEWIVFWGGRSIEENYHAAYAHQRFALDLVPAEDSVRLWRAATGVPMQLTDFACFGAPILAPAAGRVFAALDTVADNPVGQFHPVSAWGNHLVIEHLHGEYSLLAHLRQGSLQVKAGDSVRAGDVVAQCGNSGRTTAPHLHYDLVDRPDGARGTHSLPARFYNYVAGSVLVKSGEPRRWQRIRPAP